MIDTDKYEGHTEGPWTLSEEYAYELFIYAGDVRLAKMDGNAPLHTNEHGNPEDVNAQLIADAPLLLAEVKRLRGVIAKVWDLIQNSNHEEREMFFWGFDKKNTGWIKRYEELAMKELNWDWWGEEE